MCTLVYMCMHVIVTISSWVEHHNCKYLFSGTFPCSMWYIVTCTSCHEEQEVVKYLAH